MFLIFTIYALWLVMHLRDTNNKPGGVFWMIHALAAFFVILFLIAPGGRPTRKTSIQERQAEERRIEADRYRQELLDISKDAKTLNKIDDAAKELSNTDKL